MNKIFIFQPSDHTDNMTGDGIEMTKRPYPIAALRNTAEVVSGGASTQHLTVAGFADDLFVQRVDHRWSEVVKDPQAMVGKYLVTRDGNGKYATHTGAIMSVTVREV